MIPVQVQEDHTHYVLCVSLTQTSKPNGACGLTLTSNTQCSWSTMQVIHNQERHVVVYDPLSYNALAIQSTIRYALRVHTHTL